MATTIVDTLYAEFGEVVDRLGEMEISLKITAEENFRKALLMAAASYFEKRLKEHLMGLVITHANRIDLISEFVRNKAIERQYHTYFQWDGQNANSFFGLFGEGFKTFMISKVTSDTEYRDAIRAFLELGNERNRLVHQDFGTFSLEKTSKEIFELYQKGLEFVETLGSKFDEYLRNGVRQEDVSS